MHAWSLKSNKRQRTFGPSHTMHAEMREERDFKASTERGSPRVSPVSSKKAGPTILS